MKFNVNKNIFYVIIVMTLLFLSGCSESKELYGEAILEFNNNINGNLRVTFSDASSLRLISETLKLNLPEDNSQVISRWASFYTEQSKATTLKITACQSNQFETKGCDIAQFKVNKIGDTIQFIREDCSDCKKELNVINSLTWIPKNE